MRYLSNGGRREANIKQGRWGRRTSLLVSTEIDGVESFVVIVIIIEGRRAPEKSL